MVFLTSKHFLLSQVWLGMPLIPALGRQKQVVLCEIKVSLVYTVSSRPAVATGDPVLKIHPLKITKKPSSSLCSLPLEVLTHLDFSSLPYT